MIYALLIMPLLAIFLVIIGGICVLTSFIYGCFVYMKVIEYLIKSNIGECGKFILFLLSMVCFPIFIVICLVPGFLLPFVNMCVD